MRLISFLLAAIALSLPALTEDATKPVLKVVSFTADWCPNCHIFDPRLEQAVTTANDPEIDWIALDFTDARFKGPEAADAAWRKIKSDLDTFGAPRVFGDYALYGFTGMAVVVAADTQEPMFCIAHQRINEFGESVPYSVEDIHEKFRWAKARIDRLPVGMRVPEGADCPPPYASG